MNNYSEKKLQNFVKTQKEKRELRLLSRRAIAFERFAGEFADTHVSYQNINGFILPLLTA